MGLDPAHLTVAGPLQDYRHTPASSRAFCPSCGTRLWFRSDRWPGEVFLNVGTLDDPSRFAPGCHVMTADHISWAPMPEGVPEAAGFDQPPMEVP